MATATSCALRFGSMARDSRPMPSVLGKTTILPCNEKPHPPLRSLAPVRATSACSVPRAQYKIDTCTPNNLLARIPPGCKASTKQRSSEPSSTIFLILYRKSNSRIEETRVRIQFSGRGWLKIASRRGPPVDFERPAPRIYSCNPRYPIPF